MSKEMNKLEILTDVCNKHDVSFSGIESNAILDAMDAYAKQQINLSLADIRQAFADYYKSEGCSCCQDIEAHDKAN